MRRGAPAARKSARKAKAQTRGADRECALCRRVAERFEIALEHGVDNRRRIALRGQLGAGARDRPAALFDGHEVDQPNGSFRLPLQHAHEIGIVHRIEGVVFQRAFVQGRRTNEQMAEIDGAAGFRKGWCHQSAAAMRFRAKSVRHRPDIARISRVESGADLVHDVLRAPRVEPIIGARGRLDRLARFDRADLQRDDDGFGVVDFQARRRHADGLNSREAVAVEGVREIGSARIVVSDSAEKKGHFTSSCRAETISVPQLCRRADCIRSQYSRRSRAGRTQRTGTGS